MDVQRQEHHRSQIPSENFRAERLVSVFDLCQDHWSHLNGACIDLNGGQNVGDLNGNKRTFQDRLISGLQV